MTSAMQPNVVSEWQKMWGSPSRLFDGPDNTLFTVAFVLAITFHALPLGWLWKHQASKPVEVITTLQNVDLIDIEPEVPHPPPAPAAEPPKNALEFLKMALPSFSKPKDIAIAPKPAEPKIAEPERLVDKSKPLAPAPEIKLNMNPNTPAPAIAEIARISPNIKTEPRTVDPALKLEEVGRRAAAPQIQSPAISLNSPKAADVSSLPQIQRLTPTASQGDRIVDRTAPVSAPKPVIGYAMRGQQAVSLDRPRDVAASAPKTIQSVTPQAAKPDAPAKLEISKKKISITGPLSSRKALKVFAPEYPDWARARNIEADVAIRFNVSADGEVRPQLIIDRTSGYPELDKIALEAIKKWKFTPLPGNGQDQWGVITFKFLLE